MSTVIFDEGDPDGKIHGANMGPIWGRQDPDGPHVGPMNFAIWGLSVAFTWAHNALHVTHSSVQVISPQSIFVTAYHTATSTNQLETMSHAPLTVL